jgi:hypothetical protein
MVSGKQIERACVGDVASERAFHGGLGPRAVVQVLLKAA